MSSADRNWADIAVLLPGQRKKWREMNPVGNKHLKIMVIQQVPRHAPRSLSENYIFS